MLEIIATVEKIGEITSEGKKTIELSDVITTRGDNCEGEERTIMFLSLEEYKKVLGILR